MLLICLVRYNSIDFNYPVSTAFDYYVHNLLNTESGIIQSQKMYIKYTKINSLMYSFWKRL